MKTKYIITFVLVICGISIFYYIYNRYAFENELNYLQSIKKKTKQLSIGIIGDSWAAGKKIDTILANDLHLRNIVASIYSSGHPGAKSKLIYQNIYNFKSDNISSQFVIGKRPDYCLVLAGVNDIQGELGQAFYAHHLVLIIKSLIHYKIKPIILTIPRIGIDESSKETNFTKNNRNKLFRKLFVNDSKDLFMSYRSALYDSLKARNIINSVLFLNADSLRLDYVKYPDNFVSDAIHLSLTGNKILSSALSKLIIDDLKNK